MVTSFVTPDSYEKHPLFFSGSLPGGFTAQSNIRGITLDVLLSCAYLTLYLRTQAIMWAAMVEITGDFINKLLEYVAHLIYL